MPLGEGWFLNTDGRVVQIGEHLAAVLANPDMFGEPPRRRANEDLDAYRVRVLKRVFERGWIRVRSHDGRTVFEYWRWSPEVADTVWDFIANELGAVSGEIQMGEASSGRMFTALISDFLAEPRRRRNPRRNPGRELYLLGRSVGQGRA